jgi:hypothetical protein
VTAERRGAELPEYPPSRLCGLYNPGKLVSDSRYTTTNMEQKRGIGTEKHGKQKREVGRRRRDKNINILTTNREQVKM